MNIMFLDSIGQNIYGGMEEWIKLVANGLTERRHRVTIAGRPDSIFLRRIKQYNDAIDIFPVGISWDFNPVTITTLKAYITENDIDLVSVNFNKDVRLGGIAARLDGRPAVIWSVGLDITKDNIIHRYFTPRFIDGVLVPSASLKKQITRLGYIKQDIVEVVPIGIPDWDYSFDKSQAKKSLREKYNLPPDAVVALSIGRLVDQKGHIYLVQAAQEITAKYPKVRFLWLGDGPLQKMLEAEIEKMSLQDYFIFAGMMDDFDLELAGADMMIHPSVEEPFGIALLEGMRAGLPIVASRVGGIPEVVAEGETAILVPPTDIIALTVAVNDMLASEAERVSMGKAGRQRWSELFRLETMIDRVEQYFLLCKPTVKLINE